MSNYDDWVWEQHAIASDTNFSQAIEVREIAAGALNKAKKGIVGVVRETAATQLNEAVEARDSLAGNLFGLEKSKVAAAQIEELHRLSNLPDPDPIV